MTRFSTRSPPNTDWDADCSVSTTNLDAQRPVIWDLSAIAASGRPDRRKLFVDVLLASSAVPGIFPPIKIRVISEGKTYDELHVDGSVAMQVFFLPPGIKVKETEEKVFGHTRDRTLYVLRNGKLAPEYASTPENASSLARRGVATLVKYQVVYNLRLLENAARANQTKFELMGIPRRSWGPRRTSSILPMRKNSSPPAEHQAQSRNGST